MFCKNGIVNLKSMNFLKDLEDKMFKWGNEEVILLVPAFHLSIIFTKNKQWQRSKLTGSDIPTN